ncbi:pyrroline-5-carboxylate reductase [Neobacillus notoginsengisoli]|uniref:Pyrroline-5-carboxylate reductase n=1 Tax=Neobacillus notoginsengisoli TaxID=1578198 RepID=A0A417YZ05_9BACI|nr:pyrroline-5-carboxylate reductase [Neobacillus notoginsengisoli]RHW42747.1 pyrroline-5-carboxylate reductase [Neobacillus notoginsengisoli]
MRKLSIVGAGSMAEALISGIIANGLINKQNIWVTNRSDRERLSSLQKKYGICATYDKAELFRDADAVILAMKPKDAVAGLAKILPYLPKNTLVISVLAGLAITSIEKMAGRELAVVRAMPNTSAAIGKSATGLAFNSHVTDEQALLAKKLFETVGLAAFVEESQLDAVTGLSGSGPAYIYYLVEAMENSASEIGLESHLAKELIIQTLLGAAEMLRTSDKPSRQLRHEVTSPGGTTEAGIRILENRQVQASLIHCIKEATAQSKRLGRMLSEAGDGSSTSVVELRERSS